MSTRRSSARCRRFAPAALELIELGINHEQQHQELFLTDILATFAENPLEPAYGELPPPACFAIEPLSWHRGPRRHRRDRRAGESGFAFDSERPRHRVFLAAHELASRRVTNREWREFIDDGGYRTPALWLSDGWAWVQQEGIAAPLYWREDGTEFTLGGRREIDWAAPVAHVSYLRSRRLRPLGRSAAADRSRMGGFRRLGRSDARQPARRGRRRSLPRPGGGMFGDVWEWTQSAFASYPGFAPAEGAVGEYNGKFMCGQLVLKGASCATPRGHSRASYRNFFPPARALAIHGGSPCSRRLIRRRRRSATTCSPACRRRSRRSPRAGSTTAAARSCSTRSRGCRLIIRRAPRPRFFHAIMPEVAARVPQGRRGRRVRRRIGRPRPRSCSKPSRPPPTCRSTSPAIISSRARPSFSSASRDRGASRSSPISPGRSRCPAASSICPSSASSPARPSAISCRGARPTCCASSARCSAPARSC